MKLSATGMYLIEHQAQNNRALRESAPFSLGYGDLRAVLDVRRMPGKFDLHFDGRVRATGEFSTDAAYVGANPITARGYLGGKEYELRQFFIRRRGEKVDFALGRFYVAEADALKLDGGRLWWRMAKRWDASVFFGGYPNPYSRSLVTDYADAFAGAGGANATYTYDRVWGSFSIVGAYLGGLDDGGPFNPASPASPGRRENARAFLTWTSFERFTEWLDVFHDLVVDFAGAAGPQLTRLNLLATARMPRWATLRLGYDHQSAFAIEMYLLRLLAARPDYIAGTIENNLVISRTARDEGRAQLEFAFAKVTAFVDGRVRHRTLAETRDDPQFIANGSPVAPSLAWDVTLGVRDRGSLREVRIGAWYTYLGDHRSRSHIAAFEVGRAFLDERLSFDFRFLYAHTRDDGVGVACNPALPMFNPLAACFGTREGDLFEPGLTLTGVPWKKLFALLDYRMVIDTRTNPPAQPAIFTHLLLLRLEARF